MGSPGTVAWAAGSKLQMASARPQAPLHPDPIGLLCTERDPSVQLSSFGLSQADTAELESDTEDYYDDDLQCEHSQEPFSFSTAAWSQPEGRPPPRRGRRGGPNLRDAIGPLDLPEEQDDSEDEDCMKRGLMQAALDADVDRIRRGFGTRMF